MLRAVGMGLALSLCAGLAAQETTDKVELRFTFQKGEKVSLAIKQKMNVKIDEAPDMLKDFLGEEPLDLSIDGAADFEVTEVAEDGTATLEGRFQKVSAKGHMMTNDVDFAYDRAKDGDEPKKGEGEGDPGMPGLPNMEEIFSQLATQTLKLKIDKFGKMTFDGSGQAAQAGGQLFNLSALIGVLPKEKVGQGDSWKNTDTLNLPGIQQIKMKVKSTNKFDKTEKKDGVECAVIKSEFTVGTEEGEEGQEGGGFQFNGKFTGKGDGTMYFDVKGGRPVQNTIKLDVKVDITMPDPQGGDDLSIKGKFKMEQSNELKKK